VSFLKIENRIKQYSEIQGDCLVWTKRKSKSGYGRMSDVLLFSKKRYDRVHRIILAIRLGRDLLPDEFAMHTCDNPACVKPEHIVLGNALLNNRDTLIKGRRVNGHGKTNDEIKLKIIKLYGEGLNQTEIGKMFNISQVRVSQIIRAKNAKN
jgi:hypothetical protein